MNQDQEKTMKLSNNYYMELAYLEALKAFEKGEVPVGAVIVCNNKVIAKGHNKREKNQLVTSHAEMIVIKKANKKLKSWRLDNCSLYITLEPCPMCAGAIIQSRIANVYYSATDLKSGVASSIINMFELPFNHKVNIKQVDDDNKSSNLLKSFFKKVRENK